MDGCAVCECGPDPADGAEAEGVETAGEHPSEDAAAGQATVIWVDDRQLVPRSPLQVKVVEVGAHWATPSDLQGGVGDPSEQEGGWRSGSWGGGA